MNNPESSRNVSPAGNPSLSFHPPPSHPNYERLRVPSAPPQMDTKSDSSPSFLKGPKRKRLAKACDACHKSKRRCDGTAPCSNCYFATKACTYTDASGRPVPAPRLSNPDKTDTPHDTRRSVHARHSLESFQPSHSPASATSSTFSGERQFELAEDEQIGSRKRLRSQHGFQLLPALDCSPMDVDSAVSIDLEPALTRELVNLFFTHCHPQCLMVHKPSFYAAFSHTRIPSYLLHAICALAAPLSKQPRIRTNPSQLAGRRFAHEAASLMFDASGRLVCEPNLATAQALCLLQMYELTYKPSWNLRYHDLALEIVRALGVHNQDDTSLTSPPSSEVAQAWIERECVRRVFWLIHFVDLLSALYFKRPISNRNNKELLVRLPVDETSFEMAMHSTLPEYLHLPALPGPHASEFGHLIRVVSIYSKVENILDVFNGSEGNVLSNNSLLEAEKALEMWVSSLPEHLRYSEDNTQIQQSMFETGSNTGAWSFCCMHVMYASCALALNLARQRGQRGPLSGAHWAVSRLDNLISFAGYRARNSLILGAVLWALLKYCRKDDIRVRDWSADFEEIWGVRVQDLINMECGQESDVLQHSRTVRMPPPLNPIPISASSAFPSLGRSLDELRIHTRSNPPQSTTREAKRLSGDSDADLSWRGLPRSFESSQTLPSLKASGLLDSWSSSSASASGVGPASRMTSRTDAGTSSRQQPARMKTPPAVQTSPHSETPRTSASSMPVGLDWLANET